MSEMADREVVLARVLRAIDPRWGGFMNLHITDRRIIVESMMRSAGTAAAFAVGGIVGGLIAQRVAKKRLKI